MSDYQPAPVMVSSHAGGGVYGPTASHGYALPPMPNLRTKNDLTTVDQILEQMTATAYESPSSLAATGVGSTSDVTYVHGMNFRQGNSPPSVQLPSSHIAMQSAQHLSAMSDHSGTPALTPASTYNPGHSPTSSASNHSVHHGTSMSPLSSASMYPSLQTSNMHHGEYVASTSANMAPTSTLATQFDHDQRRRHSGGTLQKAQPVVRAEQIKQEDQMDLDIAENNGYAQTSELGKFSLPTSSNFDLFKSSSANTYNADLPRHMIDPVLTAFNSSSLSPSLTPKSENEAQEAKEKMDEAWVENIRLLEALRDFVRARLVRGEYEGGAAGAAMNKPGEGVEEGMKMEDGEDDMAGLYPVLREVEGVS